MKTDSRVKSDTNSLQYNLKSDTCPVCPCLKSDSSAQLSWCCCVGFRNTQQVMVFELSQSAVGFHIIVLSVYPQERMEVTNDGRYNPPHSHCWALTQQP